VPDGTKKYENGLYQKTLTKTSSRNGGPRRWLPISLRFPVDQELLDIVEDVVEVVDDLQQQVYSLDEPDLYITPETPFEVYQQEIRECKEWKKNNPEIWQTIFKDELDVETYAFCLLPDTTRAKLVN